MSLTLFKKAFSELTTGELYELLRIRNEVFVVEQDCAYQDLDYDDQPAIHLWLTEGDKIIATCRVCPAGTHMQEVSIGRVITTVRGKGYGKQIMQAGKWPKENDLISCCQIGICKLNNLLYLSLCHVSLYNLFFNNPGTHPKKE